jgi:hypothetical protein
MPTFHSIIAPNHDHLSAIGRVVVQWTFLEKTIETLVWILAPLDQPRAQAVTTHLQTLALIDIANTLMHQHLPDADLQKQLKTQLQYISSQLRPRRNSVVHGLWGPTSTTDKIALLETTARGVLKFKVGEEMTANDIYQVAADIDEANFRLMNLSFKIQASLASPPAA